jgi:transposase
MRQKERRMHQARILAQAGHKQKDIAARLGVSPRMVRYYLSDQEVAATTAARPSKLDPYIPTVQSILEEDPFHNLMVVHHRLKSLGYDGGISILRDRAAQIRQGLIQKAVIRFETEPGRQGQVDWKEAGVWNLSGVPTKLYAFVMLLGYSRRPYVRFTTSMKSPVLLACHVEAFRSFGGIPHEVLYDNMKTAWLFDGQNWNVHPRLLELASNLGFTPKRCQVRRPQTKGKVERFIQTLGNNFLPWARSEGLDSLEALNQRVNLWLADQGQLVLRQLLETRDERFAAETGHLLPFDPQAVPDLREVVPVQVNREGRITFETNRYSVPAQYLGKSLTLLVDRLAATAELMDGKTVVRSLTLGVAGNRTTDDRPQDRQELLARWQKENQKLPTPTVPKAVDLPPVIPRDPAYYDQLVVGGER